MGNWIQRDLWVIGSGEQLSNRHVHALSGIEPDEGCCRHASEHWNLLGDLKISLDKSPPLTIDKRRRKHGTVLSITEEGE